MPRDIDALLDIIEAARRAATFVAGKTREEFCENYECNYAVVRAIEIIGEAARRVSENFRALHPEVPWRDMIAMRNRMRRCGPGGCVGYRTV